MQNCWQEESRAFFIYICETLKPDCGTRKFWYVVNLYFSVIVGSNAGIAFRLPIARLVQL